MDQTNIYEKTELASLLTINGGSPRIRRAPYDAGGPLNALSRGKDDRCGLHSTRPNVIDSIELSSKRGTIDFEQHGSTKGVAQIRTDYEHTSILRASARP
jgi:hypothetical protein